MTRDEFAHSVRAQVKNCSDGGSPLYAGLLDLVHRDIESCGPVWRFLEPHASESAVSSLLPLRFLALFHGMALDGELQDLAACYPSCGGVANADRAYSAIVSAISSTTSPELLRCRMPPRVQTNEPGRSRALLTGFRRVASIPQWRGLPWRLLEPGCSAGLNLFWDRFGLAGTPLVRIAERRGCDVAPVPATSAVLLPFVWPDQTERLQLLAQAIEYVRGVEMPVDACDAVEWVERQLADARPGTATILYHSIFWLYLSPESRVRLEAIIREASERADAGAPLAWLRMEVGGPDHAVVDLDVWPAPANSSGTQRLARSGFHGSGVIEF